ncbi:hypothetical protein [Pseudomonas sp. UBA2684]|uniref:hypothetical protein n=1 Tax=Pseudomonas sp. UBA2684 TaxID=1947311 RepID=UPI0025FC401F|nr:hypothetical protein [Pseudomonas sp. UBA2684]
MARFFVAEINVSASPYLGFQAFGCLAIAIVMPLARAMNADIPPASDALMPYLRVD